jgi:hypothetical protein
MSNEVFPRTTPDRCPGPAWNDVAPMLERWQIALVPHADRSWDVLAFLAGVGPQVDARHIDFAALPQAIAAVAARCEAAGEET